MPKNTSIFEETKKNSKILEKLVDRLSTISLEDSFAKTSTLPELEVREIVQSIIAEILKKERKS